MSKFSLWPCFVLMLAPVSLAASMEAHVVEGQVRDARTRAILVSAKVELLYLGGPVDVDYSDSEGRFQFTNVGRQRYMISVVHPGYEAVELDLAARGWVEIELTPVRPVHPGTAVVPLRDYLVPNRAKKEFDRGRQEASRQNCAKAIAYLENGLRLYDQHVPALNDLGNCYRKRGDLGKAEDSFKKAAALSDEVYITLNLAELYTAQNRLADAEVLLDTAIGKRPDKGDLFYGLALVYFKHGRLPEAETAALQADSRMHQIPDLHLLLAKIYLKTAPGKVVGELERYLQEAPNSEKSKDIRRALNDAKRK